MNKITIVIFSGAILALLCAVGIWTVKNASKPVPSILLNAATTSPITSSDSVNVMPGSYSISGPIVLAGAPQITSDSVSFSWNPISPGVIGYAIYLNGKLVATSTATSTVFNQPKNLIPGTTYVFKILPVISFSDVGVIFPDSTSTLPADNSSSDNLSSGYAKIGQVTITTAQASDGVMHETSSVPGDSFAITREFSSSQSGSYKVIYIWKDEKNHAKTYSEQGFTWGNYDIDGKVWKCLPLDDQGDTAGFGLVGWPPRVPTHISCNPIDPSLQKMIDTGDMPNPAGDARTDFLTHTDFDTLDQSRACKMFGLNGFYEKNGTRCFTTDGLDLTADAIGEPSSSSLMKISISWGKIENIKVALPDHSAANSHPSN